MTAASLYEQGHLAVAAIRVLTHQKGVPPSVADIDQCLGLSSEQGGRILHRLQKEGIVEVVEGGFGTRVFVRDHLRLEELPKAGESAGLADEVKKFQASRKGMEEKIAAFKAQQEEKKKSMFAELDKQLKKEKNR